jgi:hypothetical protein
MTLHDDIMSRLPELPSGMTPTAAAMWAATTLLHAAVRDQWPHDELRAALFVLCLRVVVDDLSDVQLHAEVQRMVDQLRRTSVTL